MSKKLVGVGLNICEYAGKVERLVRCNPTFAKNGRSDASVCSWQWKYCSLIGLQYFFSRTNLGIGLAPDLPFFAMVKLYQTTERHPGRQLSSHSSLAKVL